MRGARDVLMEVRNVVKHISKSTTMKVLFDEVQREMYGQALKLVNFAMNRWSSAEECLRRVLTDYKPILRTYHSRSRRTELRKLKKVMLELYTLIRAVNIVLKDMQSNSPTSGPCFVLGIAELLASELCLEQPLLVVNPAIEAGKEEPEDIGVDMEASGRDTESNLPRGHMLVPANELTEIGRESRRQLRAGIVKRFVRDRYLSTGDCDRASYVFDAAALAHPAMYKLRHVDRMCDTPTQASHVKGQIKNVVLSKLQELWWDPASRKDDARGEGQSSRQKTLAEFRPKKPRYATFFGEDEEDDGERGTRGGSGLRSVDWAEHQLNEYLAWCAGKCDKIDATKRMDWDEVPQWWLKTGCGMFPALGKVFQSLLAMPGGAAALERDFSIASNLLTVHRARLDPAYVEMNMLLHMNIDKIPPVSQIPQLSDKEVRDAIPKRLQNGEDFKKFSRLDVSDLLQRMALREARRGMARSVRENEKGSRGRRGEEEVDNSGEKGAEEYRNDSESDGEDKNTPLVSSDSDEDNTGDDQQATEATYFFPEEDLGPTIDNGNDMEVIEV